MPLSKNARQALINGLGSPYAGDKVADIVDAGTGTVDDGTRRRIIVAFGNRKVATTFITKLQTSAALSGIERRHLSNAIGSQGLANEIATALAQ